MMIPLFQIVLGDTIGMTKMSLVENPAVDVNFLSFDKQEQPMKFSIDEEQHIVFGVALRADFPIYRFDEMFGEYFVVFTKDTIKQLYEKFMHDGLTTTVNLEHDKDTEGVYMIQSFLKDTEKGINPIGFEDVSDGSWFTAYKIENEEVWNKVKEGTFKGFSVETFGELKPIVQKDDIDELIDELLNE